MVSNSVVETEIFEPDGNKLLLGAIKTDVEEYIFKLEQNWLLQICVSNNLPL